MLKKRIIAILIGLALIGAVAGTSVSVANELSDLASFSSQAIAGCSGGRC